MMNNIKTKTMNELSTPAFDLIRQHKECTIETQTLVLKKAAGRMNTHEMTLCFENGIAGKYGKFYKADPQTLMKWIDSYIMEKNEPKNYLKKSLLPASATYHHPDFPLQAREWRMEANKCFNAFVNGVSERNFHPEVYDRMMLDGLIDIGSDEKLFWQKVTIQNCYDENILEMINVCKQKVIKAIFESIKSKGHPHVYNIKPD